MRVNRLLLGIGGLLGLLCSVALTLFPMHPAEVESKAAAWLLYAGFPEWGEGLTETTDFWVSTALWILLASIAIGLVCVALRMFRRDAAPSPEQERLSAEKITSDGKEVAKMMLRAPDLDEVGRLRTTYKRAIHPEGRLFEHFVNKAYSYRLDKAGERDKAQEFHDVVESNDKDSVREDLEFAFLVNEVENAIEKEKIGG